jgi:hypothetical protein
MKHKGIVILLVTIFVCIGAIPLLSGCAPKDPADIAAKVAEEWAENNVDSVSKSIAGLSANKSALFEKIVAMAIEKQIKDRLSWEFSTPRKISESRYEVIVTAYTSIDMAIMGTQKVSVDHILTIDTEKELVLNAELDPGSFSFKKQ